MTRLANYMDTLPDYIDYKLRVLSIGLNPSSISVEKGYYFANPRNRFWKALNASGLILEEAAPCKDSQERIFKRYKIGFTDLVKRHTSTGKALRSTDYKKWAPVLRMKIEKFAPSICWFHGKVAMQNYLKYVRYTDRVVEWGRQPFQISSSAVFVTPNPSPANAAFTLQEITGWYAKLATEAKSQFPLESRFD